MMPADAAELLSIAAAFDRRKIGTMDAIAWADALDGLDPQDCAEAIRAHFRETTAYLMPAHVRDRIAVARKVRLEHERSAGVVRAIESAASVHDPETSHKAFLAARAAFDEALRAKRAARGETEDEPQEAS